MKQLIAILLFSLLTICLLANPAPVVMEPADVVLILLPCVLAGMSLIGYRCYAPLNRPHALEQQTNRCLYWAMACYGSYLIISCVMGLAANVPLLMVLRSIGPYVNFMPLVLLALLPPRIFTATLVFSLLIMVGLMQASYQIYLFAMHSVGSVSVMDLLIGRITLLEPRTTLPFMMSLAVLPWVLLKINRCASMLALLLMVTGLLAGAVTLTRSIVLAMMLGSVALAVLYGYYGLKTNDRPTRRQWQSFAIFIGVLMLSLAGLSLVPKIHLVEQSIFSRFVYSSAAVTSKVSDYSNGRLYDEWLPAFRYWQQSSFMQHMVGIGAGKAFITASGEARTYVHNVFIYSLIYGGLWGVLTTIGLYYALIHLFFVRACQTHRVMYLSFAALVITLLAYAQLFAVHKGLAFNAMLWLLVALALQPINHNNDNFRREEC